MEKHITPERIANAIMQDKSFKGIYILVEGSKDIRVYSKFFNRTEVRLTPTNGKYKQREAFYTLTSRGFANAIAIRDADFLRIKGNIKFNPNFSDDIFVTDGHDSEMMMILKDTLEDMLSVSVEQEKKESFEKNYNCSTTSKILDLAYNIGCLRLANKKTKLGLSFKPEKPEGNRIKFKKFINEKSFELSIDQMIHTIWEYSKNRDTEVSPKHVIRESLNEISNQGHPYTEIINGHDVAEIICIISSQGLKSKSSVFQHPDRVEESLAHSFDRSKFRRTDLYQKLNQWQNNRGSVNIFSDI